MIAIFVLLGVGFLGGGAAAIVDGLPYLVLERGFTQVIIGTVVATAGVILLALAWVLVEVRRVKATLANAAMAMSVASMAGIPQAQDVPPSASAPVSASDFPPPPLAEAHQRSLGMAGAAIGAAVGAGGMLAATHAFQTAAPADAANDEAASAEHASAERDLFGDHVAETSLVEQNEQEPASPTEPSPVLPAAEDYAFPAFDPFRSIDAPETAIKASNASEASKETPVVAEPATELSSDVPAKAEAILDAQETDDAAAEETAEDHVQADEEHVEAEPGEHAGPIAWPDRDAPPVPEPEPVDVGRGTDEFSFLRESLTGRQPERDQAGQRIEPSLQHADETAAATADAESWMHPASRRRDPWFGEPTVANDPDPAEPKLDASKPDVPELDEPRIDAPKIDSSKIDTPHWPPQTREAAASAGEAEEEDYAEGDDAESAISEDARAALPERHEAASTADPEPEAPTDAPAASNEGIVGAYQVGDAHFTIYADGSIQARTPDGDYNFASMDELKVYLASEKSRLGA